MKLMKIDQVCDVYIDKLVPGGEGLGQTAEGMRVFVPGAFPGEKVLARVISAKKSHARALIEAIIEPSRDRITAPCPYFERCGGCQWQNYRYPQQLEAKRSALIENMQRIGGWDLAHLEQASPAVLGMRDPFYYRNKGQFPIQEVEGSLQLGFYAPRSHDLVPIEHCLIHHPEINYFLPQVLAYLRASGLPAYDERTHQGALRHVILRHSRLSGQSLIGIVSTESQHAQTLRPGAEDLCRVIPGLQGVVHSIHPERGNRILGNEFQLLAGQSHYLEQLGELFFELSLPSFFQVNSQQTEVLYNQVARALNLAQAPGPQRILDAYSGAGSIAIWLANQAHQIVGIESVAAASQNARRNADLNGLSGLTFLNGRVEDLLADLIQQENFDMAVLDPPRKGCEAKVLNALIQAEIPKLVYVSCQPASLARDSASLRQAGYTLLKLQGVDMFPHTHHLETVAVFQRLGHPQA